MPKSAGFASSASARLASPDGGQHDQGDLGGPDPVAAQQPGEVHLGRRARRAAVRGTAVLRGGGVPCGVRRRRRGRVRRGRRRLVIRRGLGCRDGQGRPAAHAERGAGPDLVPHWGQKLMELLDSS